MALNIKVHTAVVNIKFRQTCERLVGNVSSWWAGIVFSGLLSNQDDSDIYAYGDRD